MPISLKQIAGASTLIVLAFAGGADAEAPEWTTAAADFGEGFANARALLDPKGTLAPPLLVDGTFYMDPVETPFGVHPYPRDMRVGVLSATKSLIPGLAAMRLAQKYGPEFLDTNIVSYFAEGEEFDCVDCAARARWQGVTIRHALDMMTGQWPDGTQSLHPELVASLFGSADCGLAFRRNSSAGPIVPYMAGAGGNDVLALPNGMEIVILGRDSFNVDLSDQAHDALIAAARALKTF
jgi:hypothetical protein